MLVDCVTVPPGPVHVSVYRVGEDNFGVTNVPNKD